MDAIKKESRLLYDICCSIGLSSSQWKRNIQLIDCVTTMVNFSNDLSHMTIICGSQSEGVHTFPLGSYISDRDLMVMNGVINVQEHVDTTQTNQAEFFQLLYTDSPEYVLIEVRSYLLASTHTNFIVRKHGKYLYSSSLLKVFLQYIFRLDASSCPSVPVSSVSHMQTHHLLTTMNFNKATIHGPAVMAEHKTVHGVDSIDAVFCLRCYGWPTAAHEWIHRARPHGWPSKILIDQVIDHGCELVPVGRKDHPDEDVQWKLSFSRAETRLIRNFNIYQAQCYQLLKMVKQHFISSAVADSLSSYHIKTVMLHTVEQTDPKVWRKENLVQCFMMCLSNLKQYLTDKFLPQYFIVRQNLLEPKVTGDVHQKVFEIVTDLDKIGWKCVLQCPLLQCIFGIENCCRLNAETVPYKVYADGFALLGNKGIIDVFCKVLLKHMLRSEESVSYNSYLIQSVVFCEKTFLKPTEIQPSVETARVLQLLHKGEIGLLLTVIRAIAHPDLRHRIDPLMSFARHCLEGSIHADVSSCRLKLATFFFHLGEYDRCIVTVQDVITRFKDVWIVVGGRAFDVDERKEGLEKIDTTEKEFKLKRVLQLSNNGFPFISSHLSLPAFFTRWEIAVAPKGVHSVHTTLRSHNVCFIDSIVYAHYLLVESYLKIDELDHAENALFNMKQSIRNGKDDMFDSNCLSFCEEDKLLLEHSESLMKDAKN